MHVLSNRLRDRHGPSDVEHALRAFFGGSLVSSGICRVGLCATLTHLGGFRLHPCEASPNEVTYAKAAVWRGDANVVPDGDDSRRNQGTRELKPRRISYGFQKPSTGSTQAGLEGRALGF